MVKVDVEVVAEPLSPSAIVDSPAEIVGQEESGKYPDRLIIILLIVFILKGITYAILFPLWSAPDEPVHYINVEYKATRLDSGFRKDIFWRDQQYLTYQGKPAGYYWVAGLALVPMSGFEWPARVFALRVLSVLLNAGAVFFTYLMARELFPKERLVYLSAPMAMAMLPMFTFNGMSVNSDNLAIFLFCLFLWLAVRMIARGYSLVPLVLLPIVVMAGFLTKRTTIGAGALLVLLPLFIMFREPATSVARRILRFVPILLLPVLFFASFPMISWVAMTFGRDNVWDQVNLTLYINNLVSTGLKEASMKLPALISSFWGNFGWLEVQLRSYDGLQKLWYLPLAGYVLMLFSVFVRKRAVMNRVQATGLAFLSISVAIVIFITIGYPIAAGVKLWFPQARYIWPILGAGALLFCVGIIRGAQCLSWIPEQFGIKRDTDQVRRWLGLSAFIALALAMFYFDASILFNKIIPYFYLEFALIRTIESGLVQTVIRPATGISASTVSFVRSSIYFYVLFAGYAAAFLVFLAATAKHEISKP